METLKRRLMRNLGTRNPAAVTMEIVADGVAEGLRKGSDKMTKTLTEMPKVGDELLYVGDLCGWLTLGDSYKVSGVSGSLFYYIDDEGNIMVENEYGLDDWSPVPQPQPDVHDLIANLGRRLHEVEKAQGKTEGCVPLHYGVDVSYSNGKAIIEITFDEMTSNDAEMTRAIEIIKDVRKYV